MKIFNKNLLILKIFFLNFLFESYSSFKIIKSEKKYVFQDKSLYSIYKEEFLSNLKNSISEKINLKNKFLNLFFKEKIISTFNEAEFKKFNGEGFKNEINLLDFKFESFIQKENAKFLLEKLKDELPDIQSKDGINTFDDYIKQEKTQKVLKYILYNASKERELKKKEILFSTFFITSFVFFVYKKKFKIKS